MSKKYASITANVVDTKRPVVAGADRHPGWHALRNLASRITTPLLPDDYLRLANPLWSARELRGRIVAVRRETEDSATLVIKPGWGFSFDYQPGQYIGIGLLVDGRWRWRSYSLTSTPAAATSGSRSGHSRTVTITVKAMPEGFLSTHLVAGVEPGTIVRLAAPQGNFVLPDPAVMNNTAGGAGSGSTKLPCGAANRTIVPGLTPPTRWADRKPSGIALTVMVTVRAPFTGLDVSEYERHRQRPSTKSPIPMY